MKRLFLIIMLIMASLCCEAQMVLPLSNTRLPRIGYDAGLSFSYYLFNLDYNNLFLNSETQDSYSIELRPTIMEIGIPLNFQYSRFLLSSEVGLKDVLYTPKNKRMTLSPHDNISYPFSFKNGYLNSFWGCASFAFGMPGFQLGFSFDYFLGSSKEDTGQHLFLPIGNNSYSRFVPSCYVRAYIDIVDYRIALKVGFQYRGYFDGERIWRSTGKKQFDFDTSSSMTIFSISITRIMFSACGKYKILSQL